MAKENEQDSLHCIAVVICPLKNNEAEQISSQEFGFAVELSFDGATLDRIRNCEFNVVYASAEKILHEKFFVVSKDERCPFERNLALIVVDESHTVYNWYVNTFILIKPSFQPLLCLFQRASCVFPF